jgi:hypothetical protein
MNILVLGNGFDVAHGLKTQYKDFINSVEITDDLIKSEKSIRVDKWEKFDKNTIPKGLSNKLKQIVKTKLHDNSLLRKFYGYFDRNFWFKYFKNINDLNKKREILGEYTWIDFEREIKKVCQEIEESMYENGHLKDLYEDIDINEALSKYVQYFDDIDKLYNYAKIITRLETDLRRLTDALDVYINEFVNTQKCESLSPDIISHEVDKVLTFNYSKTYERYYDIRNNVEFDYIHGKAGKIYRDTDRPDYKREYSYLVLGYDEDEELSKDKSVSLFASFKKYYQRILIETDNRYLDWVQKFKDSKEDSKDEIHEVYFFGHSMDVTDKDVIRTLILNENVHTTIYYHSEGEKMKKLKNLISVLGYNEFLQYVQGNRITFQPQKPFQNTGDLRDYWTKMAIKCLYNLPRISEAEYSGIVDMWFNNVLQNTYSYKIKYIYMAIDALQKHQLEKSRVDVLLEQIDNFKEKLYYYEEFNAEFISYCNEETKYENVLMKGIIDPVYNKAVEKEKQDKFDFLDEIRLNKNTKNSMVYGSYIYNMNEGKLTRVFDAFIKAFDYNYPEMKITYPELYSHMTYLLIHIRDEKLVNDMFATKFNEYKDKGAVVNRLDFLQKKYNSEKQNHEGDMNGELDSTGVCE